MKELNGKSILFFCPTFFGYEKHIAAKLVSFGAHVDFYDERPKNNFITKASIRLNKNLIKGKIERYYSDILKKTAKKQYDYVFAVNIEAMLPEILRQLKDQQKNAVFVLYMWDSLQNKKKTLEILPYFERSFSFDKTDAEKLSGVGFRPLFFIDDYAKLLNRKVSSGNKLCFIGTVHSDRYNLIRKISRQVKDFGCHSYIFMYFPSPILFLYKKFRDVKFYEAKFREFSFKSMSQAEIIEQIASSKVILDIQHPGQTGLTMRTIEMIGAGRKLITTNKDIQTYDFYNPQNVQVIDRDDPIVDAGFFETDYEETTKEVYFKYSIGGWLYDLFKTP